MFLVHVGKETLQSHYTFYRNAMLYVLSELMYKSEQKQHLSKTMA